MEPAGDDAEGADTGGETPAEGGPDAVDDDSSVDANDAYAMDADARDAGRVDADSAPVDRDAAAAVGDGQGSIAEPDAGTVPDAETVPDASEGGQTLCPDEARSTWRQFQRSERVVPAIAACYQAEPLCDSGQCNIAPCLQSAAEVVGCDTCLASEVGCAAEHCAVACSIQTDDDACRACACGHGCLTASPGCGNEVAACGDCIGAGCSTRSASLTDTITVPLSFVLLHDRVDPSTNVPAYALSSGAQETILDIDARLTALNEILAEARPDHRQLRLIRASIAYAPAPAPDVCPDPVDATDAVRTFGALNVVLTPPGPNCPAAATTAFAARASGTALSRIIGNMLGIAPADQAGEPWQVTSAQFVRMHNYARWRLGATDAVPEAERLTSAGFVHGPADPIWDKLTNRDWALTNASVFEATSAGPFTLPSNGLEEYFTVPANRAARRVLGVRVSAKFTGTPSSDLRVTVSSTQSEAGKRWSSTLRVGNGTIIAEELNDSSSNQTWYWLRNLYAAGTWKVSIEDSAALTVSDIRLEIVVGDRTFLNYDRHARGVPDLMVYRPSTSELLTAPNPANGSRLFGAITRDPVPQLPDANATLILGDVDGDGTVDLLARKGSTLWVSFFKHQFTPWRPGTILGSNRPTQFEPVLLGDLDGDGFGDLFRRRFDSAAARIVLAYHRGVGDGSFEAAIGIEDYQTRAGAWALAARLGHSDLFYMDSQTAEFHLRYNTTPRPTTRGAKVTFYGGWPPYVNEGSGALLPSDRFLFMDTNLDGGDDVVAYRPSSGEWLTHLNDGDESFGPQMRVTVAGSESALREGDIVLGTAP